MGNPAPLRARKSIVTLVRELSAPIVESFMPAPSFWELCAMDSLADNIPLAITFHWDLKDLGINSSTIPPETKPYLIISPFDEPIEEQIEQKASGRVEEQKIFGDLAADLAKKFALPFQEAGLEEVALSEFNPTFGDSEYYHGLRIMLTARIQRSLLGLRSAEEEIQERFDSTRQRWESFCRKKKVPQIRPQDIDIGRFVAGGYQAEIGGVPVSCEKWTDNAGMERESFSGMLNPCRHGNQAGGHAVYCGHPSAPSRKCHYSWYTGGEKHDWQCPFYAPNPLWQEVGDDYRENADFTIEIARRLGLVEDKEEDEEALWV